MSIFTNWIFWVVLSSILFIFALIGFLTDKKSKKDKPSDNMAADNSSLNKTSSDNSNVNNSSEVLDNSNTDSSLALDNINNPSTSSFNLDSPVLEEEKVVSEPSPVQEVRLADAPVQEETVSEPSMTVQDDILDVSGSLSLGEVNSLNGNQDNPSFTNGSLGENVQMSEGESLGGDDLAIRNQVNLNSITDTSSQEEVPLQQTNTNVNEVSNTFTVSDVNSGVIAGQNAGASLNGNVQSVNETTNVSETVTPANVVNSSLEVPVNNTVSTQSTVQPIPASTEVNPSDSAGGTEKIYDTWS